MVDIASVKLRSAKDEILALAREHDELGNAMCRLAGDNVKLDDTELLLLALERAGHLSTKDGNRLHAAYMRQRGP
jgi:hypothetical protein